MREPPRPAPERVHPMVTPIKGVKPTNVGDWRNQRPVFSSRLPPCATGCPAGEQIREYIALTLQGKLADAWYQIKQDNPIPAVMGRVCYHPCESSCNRVELDEAVAIHCVERRIGDYGLEHGLKIEAGAAKAEKVAVIGSGPAGLSAAYQLARKGYGVTVYDAGAKPGGMLRYGIPAYRLPKDVLEAEIEGIAALGVEFVCGAKLGENLSWDRLRDYRGVVVSAGCSAGRKLKLPGSDQPGILDGLSFLRGVNSGEAVAQSCAGARVLVIGGGNVAIDAGRVAKRLGASEVTLAFLESLEGMPAHAVERDEARAEGVVFAPSRHFLEFESRDGRVSGARCVRINAFKLDRQSNVVVDAVPGSEHLMEADIVVVAIGQRAELGFLPAALDQVWSKVVSGKAALSDRQWIVAAGDVVDGPSSVAKAIGGGKRAAAQLEAALQGGSVPTGEQPAPLGFASLNQTYFARARREQPPTAAPASRTSGFDEVVGELSSDALLAEAGRCLHCGDCNFCANCWIFCPEASIQKAPDSAEANGYARFQVDYQTCKGCGICMRECPRGAIVMQEEFQ